MTKMQNEQKLGSGGYGWAEGIKEEERGEEEENQKAQGDN